MKTVFEKKDVNFGCYDSRNKYRINTPSTFNINYVLNLDIPLKDKFWFVRNNCKLTDRQLRELAIGLATVVLPLYEARYSDNRVREAIQAAQDYLNGAISLEELIRKRDAAADAAYAAGTASAIYAAYAAAGAAHASAHVSAYAAAYADDTLKQQLLDFLKNFTNN